MKKALFPNNPFFHIWIDIDWVINILVSVISEISFLISLLGTKLNETHLFQNCFDPH